MNYITVDKVTEILGADWATGGNANLAVMQANAFLNSKDLPKYESDQVPDPIITAGAYLVKLSISGELYKARTDGVVASKKVSAQQGTSVEKTYVAGKEEAKSADMLFIDDLLAPFLNKRKHINTFVIAGVSNGNAYRDSSGNGGGV